ncbi:hypothetical protein KIN20_030798 [Parelaphostrongylus tenuis]|uniref:Uncharacterized protein n=1 Tax=Parelaphostrongylus tenuis TaxID=148309 RepID=A0AAD5R4I5_PARTN|nr:hypothetical protein KIN20_030798 [Parelaphostrongylus tenuis]
MSVGAYRTFGGVTRLHQSHLLHTEAYSIAGMIAVPGVVLILLKRVTSWNQARPITVMMPFGSTSSEKEVATPGVVNDMEITFFDVPVSERKNDPTNSSSPDIFEDKSKDDSAAVKFRNQRTVVQGGDLQDYLLHGFPWKNRLSSSSRHITANLREEEESQALSKVTEASKLSVINVSDNDSMDVLDPEVVDHAEWRRQDENPHLQIHIRMSTSTTMIRLWNIGMSLQSSLVSLALIVMMSQDLSFIS